MKENIMTLSDAKKGQQVKILEINDLKARHLAIRLGFGEGSKLICSEKLPSGPVLVRLGKQQVAIGRSLADKITVSMQVSK